MEEDVPTLLDKRRSHHFWIDDAVIDSFMPEIGVYGLAVYAYLSRRAKRSKTFPGIRRIAKDLGIGTSTVQKTLLHLKSQQLVDIAQRRDDAGDAASNLYTLKDLSHLWGVPSGDTPVPVQNTPVPPGDTQVYRLEIHGVPPGDTEVFPLKDSHLKDSPKPSVQRKTARPTAAYSPGFLAYHTIHPVKKGKATAWKIWQREKLEPLVDKIVQSVHDHLQYDPEWARGFIKHLDSYLNAKGWEDELSTSPSLAPQRPLRTPEQIRATFSRMAQEEGETL